MIPRASDIYLLERPFLQLLLIRLCHHPLPFFPEIRPDRCHQVGLKFNSNLSNQNFLCQRNLDNLQLRDCLGSQHFLVFLSGHHNHRMFDYNSKNKQKLHNKWFGNIAFESFNMCLSSENGNKMNCEWNGSTTIMSSCVLIKTVTLFHFGICIQLTTSSHTNNGSPYLEYILFASLWWHISGRAETTSKEKRFSS